MKKALLLFLLIFTSFLFAHRVVIRVNDPGYIEYHRLIEAGADVALYHSGAFLDLIVAVEELQQYRLLYPELLVTQSEAEQTEHMRRDARDIPGYRNYQELVDELYFLEAMHPSLLKVEVIGDSWGKIYNLQGIPAYQNYGHEIFAVKLSANVTVEEDEPQFLFIGGHHAREPLSVEVCMGIINHMLDGYGVDPQVTAIMAGTEIWLLPLLNPNGHKIVTDQIQTWWRKNLNDNNGNMQIDVTSGAGYDGVDLNRNYSYRWGNVGSSDNQAEDVYHGAFPFSEPETSALRDFVLSKHFLGSISYHTYGQYVLYPFGFGFDLSSPDAAELAYLAEAMALALPSLGGGTYNPMPSYELYPVSGSAEDWLHGAAGSFAFTIEMATQFIPPASQVGTMVQDQLNAAQILLQRPTYKTVHGHITDAVTGMPLKAKVNIDGLDNHIPERAQVFSREDFGSYYRFLPAGSFELVVSAPGYLPQSRNVTISLNSATLENFNLVPASLIDVQFRITDLSGLPLTGALLELDDIQGIADDQGYMTFSNLLNGMYPVRASHPGYSTYSREWEILPGVNVIKLSDQAVLNEDFEQTANAWILTGSWAVAQGDAPQGSSYLGDNPNAQTATQQYTYAQYSEALNLEGAQSINLQFWAKTNLVQFNLYVALQYRDVFATDWQTLQTFMGITDWLHYDVDISFLAGREIELRFLRFTQYTMNFNSFCLDDLRLYTDSSYSDSADLIRTPLSLNLAPNPFKSELSIRVEGSAKAPVRLDIFNIKGQKVQSLQTKHLTGEAAHLIWNGTDAGGRRLAAGIYFLRASGGNKAPVTRKILKLN
jgi:hypothetical protein